MVSHLLIGGGYSKPNITKLVRCLDFYTLVDIFRMSGVADNFIHFHQKAAVGFTLCCLCQYLFSSFFHFFYTPQQLFDGRVATLFWI
jgi:hypothetical protein